MLIIAESPKYFYMPPAPTITPTPNFARIRSFDPAAEVPKGEEQGGVFFLLINEQAKIDESVVAYRHHAFRYLHEAGVQSHSKVEITFDSEYERVELHSVRMWRNSESIDQLDLAKFRLLQRETKLERNIYDGRHSAVLLLEDVRVGDVLEYSYSIVGWNPVFEGKYFCSLPLQSSLPVQRLYYRIECPNFRPLLHRSVNTTQQLATSTSAGSVEYSIELSDIPSLTQDSWTPSWHDPFPRITVSEFESWEQVSKWATSLFSPRAVPAANVKAEVARLIADAVSEEQKIAKILDFVQNEVRYLGMEVGPCTHRPNDSSKVLSQRFGDCKDKSLLLATMLQLAGIVATPALVNSRFTHSLQNALPSPGAFNHVVVRAQSKEEALWLDPTSFGEYGPPKERFAFDYQYALLLDNSKGLEAIPLRDHDCSIIVDDVFTITKYSAPARLMRKVEARGYQARILRNYIAHSPETWRNQHQLEQLAKFYPGVQYLKPVIVKDDRQGNLVTLTSEYSIPRFAERRRSKIFHYCRVEPDILYAYIQRPPCFGRTSPIGLIFPLHCRQTITVKLPRRIKNALKNKHVSNSAFSYAFDKKYSKRVLILKYDYRTLKDHVDPSEAEAHGRALEEIDLGGVTWSATRIPGLLFCLNVLWCLLSALLVNYLFSRH